MPSPKSVFLELNRRVQTTSSWRRGTRKYRAANSASPAIAWEVWRWTDGEEERFVRVVVELIDVNAVTRPTIPIA